MLAEQRELGAAEEGERGGDEQEGADAEADGAGMSVLGGHALY